MTRIYTRTGDAGETSLFGGRRVRKDDLRVRAYGAVDELNAVLGVVRAGPLPPEIAEVVERLQHRLFDLGAELATPPDAAVPAAAYARRVTAAWVDAVERDIDRFEAALPPLHRFILPGGTAAAAALHLARTVARRAEREIVALHAHEPLGADLLRFVNRASDLLFVLARAANRAAGREDTPWQPER